ncbi:MAG: tetratricopeptide repeat protein, partial [Candidatus Rifleibacteriota bacterium]
MTGKGAAMTFQEAYDKGNEALKHNQLADARKFFEEALKLKPNDIYTMN